MSSNDEARLSQEICSGLSHERSVQPEATAEAEASSENGQDWKSLLGLLSDALQKEPNSFGETARAHR